jgi:hypothetical protein
LGCLEREYSHSNSISEYSNLIWNTKE